jgi:actin related protein 2/3 complex, subunit 2
MMIYHDLETKKTMDEAEVAAIKASNEEVRKQRDRLVDEICLKFSCFKMHFLGAPIRRALLSLKAGAGNPADSCELPYRLDEKYWVVSAKAEVTISFALQFDNHTDRALARIFLLEFSDSKRYVKNPPAIMYHDIKFPEAIAKLFPESASAKYSNGVISFTLFPGHIKDGMEQPLAFLIGFRQYLHYHFHAIKASLHTRMRKRVETFQRVLTKAKRDQEGGKRQFKETIGGVQHEDVREERKQEEVFAFKK